MPDTYRNIGRATVEIACGDMVAQGDQTERVNRHDRHDRRLIDDGVLCKTASPKRAAKSTTEEAGQ